MLKKWSTPEARVHGVAVVHEEVGESESPQGLVLSRDGFVPTGKQQTKLDGVLAEFGEVLCDNPGLSPSLLILQRLHPSGPTLIEYHPDGRTRSRVRLTNS